ncbi:long-chain fatty acid--CoA ligase [Streptomyces nitrosporeus]|uniref:Long-chain fatty acid--CoA ligase n=1 Tax=Streptomyces nitrosporeus TaxID=28894 RepID=A0A5J6F684_9ACTN|nr:long-chain fatty acid--CoA ligase [Streptomyces nitrosporeus]GGZ10916.1 acyl-CoA synthetase [Streptomyces nitrosporeus]
MAYVTDHPTKTRGSYLDVILSHWAADDEAETLVGCGERLRRVDARRQLFRTATALRRQGLRPGASVGAFTSNRAEAVLVHLAVHLIGCRLVFLPPEPGPGELAALIDRSDCRTVVVDPLLSEKAQEAVGRCRTAPVLLSMGPGGPPGADDLPALAAACPAGPPETVPGPLPGDAVTVLYTGGTTLGRPKLPAHGRTLYDAMAASAATAPGGGRVLAATRLTHGSGHLVMLNTLLTGSCLVVLPAWDPAAAFDVLRDERITAAALVPPMLGDLLDDPRCRPGALPDLRQIHVGAAPISSARLRQAVEVFGPVISQGYGQSECLGITSLPARELPADRESPRWRSCGRPLPGTEVQIRDAEGAVLRAGETGEVCVRGPAMMLGYLEGPENTGEAVREGWLRTGDSGFLDEEGYLYLVDRVRDVIVTGRGSGNVYSGLLDDVASGLPGVREAAAVGVPDDAVGEAVRLFLVAEDGTGPDTAAVAEAITAELGELYTPREIVLVPSLPRTGAGKIDKRALRTR